MCVNIYIYTCWYDVCMYIGRYMSACDGGDGGDGGDGDGDVMAVHGGGVHICRLMAMVAWRW